MALGGEGSGHGYTPSWDEEVVPALRKRLETESKTLARRISAISLPPADEIVGIGIIKKASPASSPRPNSNLNSQQGQKQMSSLGQSQSRGRGRATATPGLGSNASSGPKSPASSSSRSSRPTTGNPSPSTTKKYHRSRTYSSPHASDMDYPDSPPPPPSLPNGSGTHDKAKQRKLSTDNSNTTKFPPTRIPKVQRPPTSASSTSQTNGSTYPNTPNGVATNSYGHTSNSSYSNSVTPTTPTPKVQAASVPDPFRQASLDYPRSTRSSASASQQRGLGIGIPPATSGSSRSTFDLPRGSFGFSRSFTTGAGGIGLMNETPPFPTETSMASGLSSRRGKQAEKKRQEQEQEQEQEYRPRPSFDSDERPYEHWYRGEVSRNGGVGELKVVKRQEMLDIANYGHMIRSRDRSRKQQPLVLGGTYEDGYEWRAQTQHPHPSEWTGRGQRKRAGSIGGLTDRERERGSVCLDDEEDSGERVMDQEPLTDLELDLEGEEGMEEVEMNVDLQRREDLESDKTRVEVDPEDADEFVVVESFAMATPQPPVTQRSITPTPTPPQMQHTPTANRSTTPTAMANRSTTPTSSSGRPSNSNSIPRTRIPSRKSTDSRSTVASSAPTTAVKVEVATIPGSSISTPQQASSAQKRGASPGTGTPSSSKKARSALAKAKSKTPPSATKKGKENKEKDGGGGGGGRTDKRTSVAMYPTVEGGDELADAIPSWMEPVSEGNWDDVVLPVVARKKGLDGYYENTSGSLHQLQLQHLKAKAKAVEPAPGTFRYDHSKYRPFKEDNDANPNNDTFISLDEFGVPPSSTAPTFEDPPKVHQDPLVLRNPKEVPPQSTPYAKADANHGGPKVHQMQMEEEENGAGCCRCVVM